MSFAFKKFSFLQHTEIQVHSFPKNASSSDVSEKHVFVGCEDGTVHVLDSSFQLIASFQAHAFRVFQVVFLQGRNLLLTLGSEEPGYSTTHIKIWDVSSTSPGSGAQVVNRSSTESVSNNYAKPISHTLVKLVKVFNSKHPEGEITAFSALEIISGTAVPGVATTNPTSSGNTSGTAGAAQTTVLAAAVGLATGLVYVILLDMPHVALPDSSAGSKAGGGVTRNVGGPVTAAKPISVQRLSARPDTGHAWTVTGLALHGVDTETLSLFAVTESQTLSFNLKANTKSVLDAQGAAAPGCCVLRPPPVTSHSTRSTDQGQHTRSSSRAVEDADCDAFSRSEQPPMLTIARDEGLYNFAPDTRAGCTVLEGSKQRLVLLGRHVVVVTRERTEVGTTSATVFILDVPHKLISGSLTVGSVAQVLAWKYDCSISGSGNAVTPGSGVTRLRGVASQTKPMLVVVTGSNKLYTFKEVPLSMQLESLFKRSLHKLALDLARVQHADDTIIANIQRKWGDALYTKGDFDAAMSQYMETIGHLEPSYVIRRFLDAQRIHNLTAYLELLHHKGIAGADHTTLLLNCYTKLKDVEKLDAFIQRSVPNQPSTTSQQQLDNAVASHADSSGSGGAAGKTTESSSGDNGKPPKKPEAKARRGKGKSASIDTTAAAAAGSGEAGGSAAQHAPQQGQELKFDADTAVKVLRAAGYPGHALTVAKAAGHAGWQLDILLEDCQDWDKALHLMASLSRPECAAALRRVGKVLVTHRPEPTTSMIMDLCAPSTKADAEAYAGSVADFAHLFCDAPTALMLLCEFILNTAPPGSIADERMLHHTLLELYLSDTLDNTPQSAATTPAEADDKTGASQGGQASSASATSTSQQQQQQTVTAAEADKRERRGKAFGLLQSGWPPHLEQPKYDQEHALVLCRLAGFNEGLVLLYDRLRLYREVLQVHMSCYDYPALVATAVRYGDSSRGGDPHLWAMLLEYLAKQDSPEVEHQVQEVVSHIEAGAILPPVMVLTLLASNQHLKVRTLRGYVSRFLSRESSEAARDREAAARLAADSAQLRAELARLKSQARVFQSSRCAATGQPLELPAVHFMCGHAFNLRALGDNDKECPLCAPDYKRVVEIRRNMAASAMQQDRFFTELRESSDGFSVVADHFGRGLMNMTVAALSSGLDPGGARAGLSGAGAASGSLAGLTALSAPTVSL